MTDRLSSAALMWIEAAINQALQYDPGTRAAISALEGKVVAIESTLPPLKFFVLHYDDGISLMSQYEGEPDTVLKGTALSLVTLAAVGQDQVSFFATGVEVEGNQELLRSVRQTLVNLDVDWEAILAKLIGDVPAHLLGQALRSATNWQKSAFGRAGDVLTGFHQEEAQITPSRAESEHFYQEVQKLKQDVDRAEARITHLAGLQQGGES